MGMFYVYILRSESHAEQTYVGFTANLKQRLLTHNQGGSVHTARFAPWQIEFYCAFKDESRALEFERYLKSHSGKAFANKRLLQMAHQK
jgi:predicted GIY-YIG superfamily endonuclease